MTKEERKRLRELEEAAWSGPWGAFYATLEDSGGRENFVQREDAVGEFEDIICRDMSKYDAKFVAAARNSIVPLLDQVDQLEEDNTALRIALLKLRNEPEMEYTCKDDGEECCWHLEKEKHLYYCCVCEKTGGKGRGE